MTEPIIRFMSDLVDSDLFGKDREFTHIAQTFSRSLLKVAEDPSDLKAFLASRKLADALKGEQGAPYILSALQSLESGEDNSKVAAEEIKKRILFANMNLSTNPKNAEGVATVSNILARTSLARLSSLEEYAPLLGKYAGVLRPYLEFAEEDSKGDKIIDSFSSAFPHLTLRSTSEVVKKMVGAMQNTKATDKANPKLSARIYESMKAGLADASTIISSKDLLKTKATPDILKDTSLEIANVAKEYETSVKSNVYIQEYLTEESMRSFFKFAAIRIYIEKAGLSPNDPVFGDVFKGFIAAAEKGLDDLAPLSSKWRSLKSMRNLSPKTEKGTKERPSADPTRDDETKTDEKGSPIDPNLFSSATRALNEARRKLTDEIIPSHADAINRVFPGAEKMVKPIAGEISFMFKKQPDLAGIVDQETIDTLFTNMFALILIKFSKAHQTDNEVKTALNNIISNLNRLNIFGDRWNHLKSISSVVGDLEKEGIVVDSMGSEKARIAYAALFEKWKKMVLDAVAKRKETLAGSKQDNNSQKNLEVLEAFQEEAGTTSLLAMPAILSNKYTKSGTHANTMNALSVLDIVNSQRLPSNKIADVILEYVVKDKNPEGVLDTQVLGTMASILFQLGRHSAGIY